jgi:hypothetical protein
VKIYGSLCKCWERNLILCLSISCYSFEIISHFSGASVYGTIAGFSLTKVIRRNLDGPDNELDEEYDGWEEFLTDEAGADFSNDIYSVDILSEDWKGTYPWDDENWDIYCTWRTKSLWIGSGMIGWILATRQLDGVKEAAMSGCPKSNIELNHLKRNQGRIDKAKKVIT